MELITKQGYRQTEAGLLPKDWSVFPLKDLLIENPKYGIGAAAVEFNYNLFTYLRITDIDEKGRIIKEGLKSVDHADSENYILKKEELVFARTGASVGKSYLYNPCDGILVFAGFLIKVKPDNTKLNSKFLRELVNTKAYWNWLAVNSMRSGQPGINSNELGTFLIPLPPTLTEQKAIATALSDVDELITGLESLITKKKAIKQGAMQQLLIPPHKGGKRLPGFTGEWVERKLEEVLKIVTDYTANGSFASLKENVTYYSEMNFAVLVRTTDLGKKDFEPKRFTNIRGYDFLEKTNLFGGEIIMANVGSVGKVFKVPKYNMPMTLAPNTYLLKFHNFIDNQYMYLWMKTSEFVNKLMSKVGSTTLLAINKDNLRDIDICMPIDIEEQKTIAQILSDMNEDIEQLESKKAKYQSIKQGMMQELLTGKTRLV